MKKKPKKESDEERFERLHPYPRWSGLVCLTKYMIGKFDGKTGLQPVYLCTDIDEKTIELVREVCNKHILKVVEEEGGSSIDSIICANDFPPNIRKQIDDSEDDTPTSPLSKSENNLITIAKASLHHRRIRMTYIKKSGVKVVREVACYSYKDGFVYVTDTKHGNGKIRSYKLDRIKKLVVLKKKFKPQWDIEF